MVFAVETRNRNAVFVDDIGKFTSLFKFISLTEQSIEKLEQTLAEAKLTGTSPDGLNDPFESLPYLIDDLSDKAIREACEYRSRNEKFVDLTDKWLPLGRQKVFDKTERFLKSTRKNARIISFCRRVDSQLLWSHYANSHKGLCLHFSSGGFPSETLRRGTVAYATQRPTVLASLVAKLALPEKNSLPTGRRIEWRTELYRSMFFTKPIDWNYEEEYRLVYSNATTEAVEFGKDALLEVIFGVNTPKGLKNKVKSLTKKYGYQVAFREAEISKTTFSVDVSKLAK